MKKVGFLGGSFDPIHFGHIHLGISLQEAHGLDEVVVCPAYYSPLKQGHVSGVDHRLSMVRLAIQEIPSWSAVDWEVTRQGFSYTIDTLQFYLRHVAKGDVKIFLLLGEDLLPALPRWKEVDKLLTLAQPLIGLRRPAEISVQHSLKTKLAAGMTIINVLEISATDIRQRLYNNRYCGHLVPAKVLDYIREHRLYSAL